MKRYNLAAFILCFLINTSYSQLLTKEYLSSQLEPYRKHLDKVASQLAPYHILEKYRNKMKIGDTIVTKNYLAPHSHQTRNYKAPYLVSDKLADQIDTSAKLFSELDLPIPNSNILFAKRKEFFLALSATEQITKLLSYIELLKSTLDANSNRSFINSRLFEKYKREIERLFNTLPNNNRKVEFLLQYVSTLKLLGIMWEAKYISTVLIEAETILLTPFWRQIEPNEIRNINAYNRMVLTDSSGELLASVYSETIEVFKVMVLSNQNNEAYPFVRKKNQYIQWLIQLYKILATKNNRYYEQVRMFEAALLIELSKFNLTSKARFSKDLIQDQLFVLDSFMTPLLTSPAVPIDPQRSYFLYLTLGFQFESIQDYQYAFHAYTMALSEMISNNIFLNSDFQELAYSSLLSLLTTKWQGRRTYQDSAYVSDLANLYLLTNNDSKLSSMLHTNLYHNIRRINATRFLILFDDKSSAKETLFSWKRTIVNDSVTLRNNPDMLRILNLVYQEIKNNSWLSEMKPSSNFERFADSIIIEQNDINANLFPFVNGSEDILQEFADLETSRSLSKSQYFERELSSLIFKKKTEIVKLEADMENAYIQIAYLTDSIDYYEEKLGSLTDSISILKGEKVELQGDNKVLQESNGKLIKQNESATQLNAFLENARNSLILFVAFLVVLSIDLIGSLVIKLRKLRGIADGLVSKIESDKKRYESEIRYENEKVLREYSLKHEIVTVLQTLYDSFSALIIKLKIEESRNILEKLSNFNQNFGKMASFSRAYYKRLTDNRYFKVDEEIELAFEYVSFIKLNGNISDIAFFDKRSIRNQHVVLPPHCINNFVKNSIEKGKRDFEDLTIEIFDLIIGDDYVIQIIDDGIGVGVNFSITGVDAKSTGLRSVMKQIQYYNLNAINGYKIIFNDDSVFDRKSQDGQSGTIVQLKFQKIDGHKK